MEDPESEWEIQEYPCSKEGETTMAQWILNKGYGIGKKVVITGIAMSSAPLVLPPLMVFSAMGIAFSVPFGLVFASYACTNKLMSKLLGTPTPPPPLMLEYYYEEDEEKEEGWILEEKEDQLDYIEQEGECSFELDEGSGDDYRQIDGGLVANLDRDADQKGYCTDEDDDISRENVVQEEQLEVEDDEVKLENMMQEEVEDIKQGVELGLELDDDDDDAQEKEVIITNMVVNVNENGTEWEDYELKLENVVQDEDEQEREVLITNMDENANENEDEDEDETKVLQSEDLIREEERSQLEDIKEEVQMRLGLDMAGAELNQADEGSISNFGGSVDEQGYEEDVGEYLEGEDGSLEEERKEEKPSVSSLPIDQNNTSIREDEQKDNTDGDDYFLGETSSNGTSEEAKNVKTPEPVAVKVINSEKLVQNGSKNDQEPVSEMRQVVILAGGNEENNFNSREVEELDLVAREVVGDSHKNKWGLDTDEEVMRESMGSQDQTSSNKSNDEKEDAILKTRKEHLIHSNADAREIADESGLDLFDDQKASTYENANANLESPEGDEVKESVAHENVDVLALPIKAPSDSDYAKVASKTDTKPPPREEILDDEKMWEKIGAMRAIVGYKAARQATCIEELKALYVFTGVEPPASFKGNSDLDEVNSKLKFLMSIVGVK